MRSAPRHEEVQLAGLRVVVGVSLGDEDPRDAARGWFLWPIDRRLLILAKNACAYLFSLLIFSLLCAVQAFAGHVSPLQFAAVGLATPPLALLAAALLAR